MESDDVKIDCRGNYSMRDTLLLERIAVILDDYPNDCFKLENVKSIEEQVFKHIDSLMDEQKTPAFQYRKLERGYWNVKYIDESTRAWLMEVMRDWMFLENLSGLYHWTKSLSLQLTACKFLIQLFRLKYPRSPHETRQRS